jgi:preprotein translocase subunit Sec63
MEQNIWLIVSFALIMGLVIAPYYLWKGWQETRRSRAAN